MMLREEKKLTRRKEAKQKAIDAQRSRITGATAKVEAHEREKKLSFSTTSSMC